MAAIESVFATDATKATADAIAKADLPKDPKTFNTAVVDILNKHNRQQQVSGKHPYQGNSSHQPTKKVRFSKNPKDQAGRNKPQPPATAKSKGTNKQKQQQNNNNSNSSSNHNKPKGNRKRGNGKPRGTGSSPKSKQK